MPMTHVVLLALVGFVGGTFGAMVGLGGGVFIIPTLALFLDVPIHSAIAASLLAVIATSTTAAAAYVRDDLTNLRLGMTLETTTVTGAVIGGLVGTALSKTVLSAVFGGVMIAVSVYMAVRQRNAKLPPVTDEDLGLLGASYHDRSLGETVRYRVRRLPAGMAASFVAGNVSGLLGVGGGFLKVPVMVLAMSIPVRAAVSTSSFMIGVTACAGALVYFARGLVDPVITVPVVLGVTLGAYLGSKLAMRVKSSVLTIILAIVLFAFSVQMILSAAGIDLR
ncbi:MAG: hypothetical protein A2133_03535 [Actinobacteria bacterium RBG_16_64_13]|nr:MAG: hypothetical protein A2133_03535 [Actinobacteria bacterium RBG_16_64_13]